MAHKIQGGRAIKMDTDVTHIVPIIKGKNPKSPLNGFQLLDVINSGNDFISNMGDERTYNPQPIIITINMEMSVKHNMSLAAILSLTILQLFISAVCLVLPGFFYQIN